MRVECRKNKSPKSCCLSVYVRLFPCAIDVSEVQFVYICASVCVCSSVCIAPSVVVRYSQFDFYIMVITLTSLNDFSIVYFTTLQ
jgi:hypothetical protein